MSSFLIIGFFALSKGHVIGTPRPGGGSLTSKWHVYSTGVQWRSNHGLRGELRVFAGGNNFIYPNNTVAFVVGHAAIDRSHVVLIECDQLIPVPGDPTDEDYDEFIPNMPAPAVITLGPVSIRSQSGLDDESDLESGGIVYMSVSGYVRDKNQKSEVK
jgi:hypothetical protein